MARKNDALADTSENQPRLGLSARSPPPNVDALTRLRRWPSRALARPPPFGCSVTFVGTFPIPPLAARNEPTTTSASQSKPIGIASRNVPAIEQGVVLSPSLPPRAARPAPRLGGSRAVLSLAQQGRQRSDRQADRPT